jgi:hypothetical protein
MEVGQGPNWGCSAKKEKNYSVPETGGGVKTFPFSAIVLILTASKIYGDVRLLIN